jgi:hypothetical protein
MGGACTSVTRGRGQMHTECLPENVQGRHVTRDLAIDGRALRVLKLTHRSRMRYSRAVPKGGGRGLHTFSPPPQSK